MFPPEFKKAEENKSDSIYTWKNAAGLAIDLTLYSNPATSPFGTFKSWRELHKVNGKVDELNREVNYLKIYTEAIDKAYSTCAFEIQQETNTKINSIGLWNNGYFTHHDKAEFAGTANFGAMPSVQDEPLNLLFAPRYETEQKLDAIGSYSKECFIHHDNAVFAGTADFGSMPSIQNKPFDTYFTPRVETEARLNTIGYMEHGVYSFANETYFPKPANYAYMPSVAGVCMSDTFANKVHSHTGYLSKDVAAAIYIPREETEARFNNIGSINNGVYTFANETYFPKKTDFGFMPSVNGICISNTFAYKEHEHTGYMGFESAKNQFILREELNQVFTPYMATDDICIQVHKQCNFEQEPSIGNKLFSALYATSTKVSCLENKVNEMDQKIEEISNSIYEINFDNAEVVCIKGHDVYHKPSCKYLDGVPFTKIDGFLKTEYAEYRNMKPCKHCCK